MNLNMSGQTTLTQFLIHARRKHPDADGSFNELIQQIALACKRISHAVARGSLAGHHGEVQGAVNVQGEQQKKLDVIADEIMTDCARNCQGLAGLVSEEQDDFLPLEKDGRYLLLSDPLDGSSNIDVNSPVGTIFSVLLRPDSRRPLSHTDFLQPGSAQVAAGYALYGPATMLVLTVGDGVYGFTLDGNIGEFILTHADLKLPDRAMAFAINASNRRFWEPPVVRYVEECLAGKTGPRGRDFNMRWVAALVAEAHRILLQGGVFLYPKDTKEPRKEGRLRLLYEANPIAWLIEQANGKGSNGREPVLQVRPTSLHQRIGFVFGNRGEVRRVEHYHHQPAPEGGLLASKDLFKD